LFERQPNRIPITKNMYGRKGRMIKRACNSCPAFAQILPHLQKKMMDTIIMMAGMTKGRNILRVDMFKKLLSLF
jgi:hypothetical protein